MKTKKKLLILLSAVLLTATLIACFAIFSGAQTVTPEMKITNCSLSFSDSVYIKYAVKTNVDDLKLLVWTEPQTTYTVGTEKYTAANHYSENIDGISHEIFDLKELSARMMTDNVYACAYAKVGGMDYYSDLNKYSILQYAYNKLGKTATVSKNETLEALLSDMLTYGASAQKHFNYKTTRLASADWYQVKLTASTLDDGFAHGLYLEGDKVTLSAPEANFDGKKFDGWYNSADTKIATDATTTITVSKNETYTPKYNGVTYSTGLQFVSNGDGTCYISGIGTCTDADIIIPRMSPTGDKVTGIGQQAFYLSRLTSVTVPDSVTSIGDGAFYYCFYLTNITVPNSVTSIGEAAFFSCTNLTSIAIPNSLTSIGSRTFFKCESITAITIPDSVTSIGDYAFHGCTSLTSITIPNSVTSIGGNTFSGCTGLTSIT